MTSNGDPHTTIEHDVCDSCGALVDCWPEDCSCDFAGRTTVKYVRATTRGAVSADPAEAELDAARWGYVNPNTYASLPLKTRENLGTLDRRILALSDWIERDRHEPDKIITYAQQLRAVVLRAEALRHA